MNCNILIVIIVNMAELFSTTNIDISYFLLLIFFSLSGLIKVQIIAIRDIKSGWNKSRLNSFPK